MIRQMEDKDKGKDKMMETIKRFLLKRLTKSSRFSLNSM
jgi:hypothetical protein